MPSESKWLRRAICKRLWFAAQRGSTSNVKARFRRQLYRTSGLRKCHSKSASEASGLCCTTSARVWGGEGRGEGGGRGGLEERERAPVHLQNQYQHQHQHQHQHQRLGCVDTIFALVDTGDLAAAEVLDHYARSLSVARHEKHIEVRDTNVSTGDTTAASVAKPPLVVTKSKGAYTMRQGTHLALHLQTQARSSRRIRQRRFGA